MLKRLLACGALVLAMIAPAHAVEQHGMADPLGLAASGVLIPYLGHGIVSVLEVASPIGANPNLHMFFYNETCTRVGDSAGLPEVPNEVGFVDAGRVVDGSGLIAVAGVDVIGFDLVPLASPIHSRVYLFDPASGRSSILDPIILDAAANPGGTSVWSPLRPAVTFYAPRETAIVNTRILLTCPTQGIQGASIAAFPTSRGFPAIVPPFAVSTTPLNVRIYLPDGTFARNTHMTCRCLSDLSVMDISNVYAAAEALDGTFTEIEVAGSSSGFTGYRGVFTVGSGPNNFFGRLSNAGRLQ